MSEFAATLTTTGPPCTRVVVCMVHDDDSNELDEPFYLARVVKKARVIDRDCLVGGNSYKAGDLVANIKWYCYVESSRGDRIYRLQPGSSAGVVYSVKSIIKDLTGLRFKSYEHGRYILGRDAVRTITNFIKIISK